MTPEERKIKIAELRKLHEPTFLQLGIPGSYFACKFPHTPEGMEGKFVGFYQSEVSKGDDIYLECVTMDYKPLDASRRLYVWRHNPQYRNLYEVKKEQYLIPVSELHVVTSIYDNCMGEDYKAPYFGETGVRHTPAFEKKETSERHYKEEVYESADGSKHRIEFKNGLPSEYQFTPNKEGIDKSGFIMRGEHLVAVFEFIKSLKY